MYNYNVNVPFVDNKIFQWAQWEDCYNLPAKVLYDGRLWKLVTGMGSTYYVPANGQLWLPGIDLTSIGFKLINLTPIDRTK